MTDAVLDASAVLARILDEVGADRVDEVLEGARVCSVNLTEVVQRLSELGLDEMRINTMLRPIPCIWIPFDEIMAVRAGLLRQQTRRLGLSLGDRACLALGMGLGARVFTTDRAWAELDLGVEIVLIR